MAMYSPYDTPKGGLPHSDIRGSKPIGGSPQLFAAYHVLHRLLAPRHPPNALITLDRYHRNPSRAGTNPTRNTLHMIPSTTAITYSQYANNRERKSVPIPEGEPSGKLGTLHSQTFDTGSEPARWWAWEDLNFRPHAYQARALTN
jgi:hypothetical protein